MAGREAELAALVARVNELNELVARNADQQPANAHRVDHYRVPKLPPFYHADPALWFLQAEVSMRNARITTDATMADTVIAALDVEVLSDLKDILMISPAPADRYTQIKTRTIAMYAVSDEANLRKLLKGQVLNVGKPSLMLRKLLALNNSNCSNAVVRSIFLDQLSETHRAILVASKAEDLEGLAEAADRLADSVDRGRAQISAVGKGSNATSSLEDEMRRLIAEVANLNKKMDRLDKKVNQSRPRSASRRRSLSRPRSGDSPSLCGAHTRYPDNPTTCQKWCAKYPTWSQKSPKKNE